MTPLEAALSYVARGWEVFPVPPNSKKSYKSREYSGDKWGKTRDAATVKEDWQRWPQAGIGLPTGHVSGFWVVEADTPQGHNVDGIAAMAALEAEHGALPPTLQAISPSGSIHWYFGWPASFTDEIRNSTSTVAPGLDVRGQGGMVVAPPTVRRGRAYAWLNDNAIVDAPRWLVDAAVAASSRQRQRRDNSGDAEVNSSVADIERIVAALDVIPNETPSWQEWCRMGMAVYRATGGSEAGFDAFDTWSQKWRGYDAANTRERWESFHRSPPTEVGAGTIFYMANEACPGWDRITVEDFWALAPMNSFIFVPTRDLWPAASVDARLPPMVVVVDDEPKRIKPHVWLSSRRSVEQMTWVPGQDMVIKNRLIANDGWVERYGVKSFNMYRPPRLRRGDPTLVGPWLDHVDMLLSAEERQHVVSWLAHRVQRPGEKINHALLIGGAPGIGKDTLFEPVKRAVGSWNFREVSPTNLLESFNDYLKCVILRVSEARDLGEVNRFTFYERTKTILAVPPNTLRINEKHTKAYDIFNVLGMIITTNYKHDGVYLPADDRRHYVVWSDLKKEDFDDDYWNFIWGWYDNGGAEHVLAYLQDHDISRWDPSAPPERTQAFWDIANSNRAPEEDELADAIEKFGFWKLSLGEGVGPDALTLLEIQNSADGLFAAWLADRRNARAIPHRLERCGYVAVHNSDAKDKRWKIKQTRHTIYAKISLTPKERSTAANACRVRIEKNEYTERKKT